MLARVLMRHPPRRRFAVAKSLLAEVEIAARRLCETGKADPRFGDGSLMARCHRACPAIEPMADDPDFLQSLGTACRALLVHSGA